MPVSKQILYISYDGLTDPLGQSQVLPYVIGIAKTGCQFTIISFEKRNKYNQNKNIIEEICQKNKIDWQPVFYTKNPPIFSTIWDILKLNRKAKKLHAQKKFSLIHCRSYIPSLIGLGFKRKHGIKFLFDMRGFWADERVDGDLWNLNKFYYKWIYNYFKKKERAFLTYADKVISLTENGKHEMLSWNIPKLSEKKIEIIPCSADYDLFNLNTPENKIKAKLNLEIEPTTFVLTYIGSLGTWYLADEMLLFFSILKKKISNTKFLFLTPDSKESIFRKAKKFNLEPNDFIIKFSQRKEIPKYAHASDFSIFFIKPSYSKKSSSPTKMGELLAMGIPLICNNNVGDVEIIMNETGCGFCLNELNTKSFEKIVSNLVNWNLNSPQGIRENSKKYYDLKNGLHLYVSTYNELLSE